MTERGTCAVLATVAVLSGWALVVRPLEAGLAERSAAVVEARHALEDKLGATGRVSGLVHQRTRLRNHLANAHLEAGRAAATERFLRVALAAAARRGTSIREVRSASGAVPRPTGPPPVLDEVPFQLSVRGSFPALLDTVRDLINAPLAARIVIDALAPDDRLSTTTGLIATVRVALLRAQEEPRVLTQPH